MPPPSSSNKANPDIRAASSRKRKETRRAIENADPLLLKHKKQKTAVNSIPTSRDTDTNTYHSSQSTRTSSVAFEGDGNDVDDFAPSSPGMHALDDVLAGQPGLAHDGSDSGEDEIKSIIDVDEALGELEETAEAELSRLITKLYYHQAEHFRRATVKGLERTYLRVFSARA
jgi:hypothetical protein